METVTIQAPAAALTRRTTWSELVFRTQASRPAVGAPRLFPLVDFLGGAFLRAGSAGARPLRRERYRGRGSRCLQSAEGHVSFWIFGRQGAIGCAAVENCRRTSAVLGGIFVPYRNENFALVCGVGDRGWSLQCSSRGMEGAPSV